MHFYTINYSHFLADLCRLEMKSLFGLEPGEKHFFSDRLVPPSRSPFLKDRLTVQFEGDSLDSLVDQVLSAGFAAEAFKVSFLAWEGTGVGYQERLHSGRVLGAAIDGDAKMHDPAILFGVTEVGGRWYFGGHERNNFNWHHHDNKPFTYSSSLNFRMARALVNIGVGMNTGLRLIDPCCGVGTVVIEALSMGIDACGYEINTPIAISAQKNVAFFSYPDVIREGDMHDIRERYDLAIIDIPYGLYQQATVAGQAEILNSARRIADRLVLVTMENLDAMILAAGFRILERARVASGRIVRYVQVCG